VRNKVERLIFKRKAFQNSLVKKRNCPFDVMSKLTAYSLIMSSCKPSNSKTDVEISQSNSKEMSGLSIDSP